MSCEDVQPHFADYVAGTLARDLAADVARHLHACRDCRAEVDGVADTWKRLGELPGDPLPAAAMRARFEATLEGYDLGETRHTLSLVRWRHAAWLGTAAALLIIGVAIGRLSVPAPATDARLAVLHDEIRTLREMTALALLEQRSPSDRLNGVRWTGQIDRPGNEVAVALLETLMRDPNVNVRLAAVDALGRFGDRESVRRGAVEALNYQSSPLVQIALIDFVAEVSGRDAADIIRRLSNDSTVNEAVRARATAMLEKIG